MCNRQRGLDTKRATGGDPVGDVDRNFEGCYPSFSIRAAFFDNIALRVSGAAAMASKANSQIRAMAKSPQIPKCSGVIR
jgi:hypothetical protein